MKTFEGEGHNNCSNDTIMIYLLRTFWTLTLSKSFTTPMHFPTVIVNHVTYAHTMQSILDLIITPCSVLSLIGNLWVIIQQVNAWEACSTKVNQPIVKSFTSKAQMTISLLGILVWGIMDNGMGRKPKSSLRAHRGWWCGSLSLSLLVYVSLCNAPMTPIPSPPPGHKAELKAGL